MSGITLSASVRQNLLSLQSTADLLSTTQSRLSTGNKVNSALDNPTNFFTAQGLNNRASDINNLLDGIGNGVQILQAANTGITSLQKLVDSAKSIANQALQATTGYSTKSQAVSSAVTGATASNLLGGTSTTTAATHATTTGNVDVSAGLADAGAGTDVTFTINNKVVTLTGGTGTAGSFTTSQITDAINNTAGIGVHAAIDGTTGFLSLTSTGTAGETDTITTSGLNTAFGIADATGNAIKGTDAVTTTTGGLSGLKLTIGATDAANGGKALDITFGSGTYGFDKDTGVATNVKTLDQLNEVLAANNMQASLSSDGKLTLTTTNDHASSSIGAIAVTPAAGGTNVLGDITTVNAPQKDTNAQNTRASLVAQYNTVMDQIKTTAADSSFNGVNLLNGDTLALTFNETGKSKLSITGVTFDTAGLGLNSLTSGTDFLDNTSANKILTSLNDASSKLRSQASAFGSNLSVVQMRQDFSKQMINVLQTGASNLTLADTNEEAANSQALSTRQSIAVSALSLANQSQQGVLQLLR